MNENIRNLIKNIPNVSAAYLFGSRAAGTNKDESDYDICIVISDNNKDMVYKAIVGYMIKNKEFIQALIYTEKEFKEKLNLSVYKEEIIKKGISIL